MQYRQRALVFALIFGCAAFAAPSNGDDKTVAVMTRNLYHGAEFGPVFAATTFPQFVTAVRTVFDGVKATKIPERAQALADEIEETRPDLVGLQEVVLWRSQFPADFSPTPNATTIEFDFLQLLLDALAARGLNYRVVAISTGTDIEAPGLTANGTCCRDIRFTDREVILARTDHEGPRLKLSNAQVGNFATNCVIPSGAIGAVTILRGWASVDAMIRGEEFRFVTTHLDGDCLAFTSAIQVAQANEILQGPANSTQPVILVGDFNSNADGSNIANAGTPTYGNLLAAGFNDAWSLSNPADPGFTCCQASNLQNSVSTLQRRIDLVLFRGHAEVDDIEIVGDDPDGRTISGLWPSDHAGVVATLELRKNDKKSGNGHEDND